jgi:hypothetical protein
MEADPDTDPGPQLCFSFCLPAKVCRVAASGFCSIQNSAQSDGNFSKRKTGAADRVTKNEYRIEKDYTVKKVSDIPAGDGKTANLFYSVS